jgi:uncharacterized protein
MIHRFRTERHPYVYDTHTNRILRLDESVWKLCGLDHGGDDRETLGRRLASVHPELPEAEREEALDRYEALREEGLFRTERPTGMMEFGRKADHRDLYKDQLGQLILEVTEACNLRCRYCTYSDYYPGNRSWSDLSMGWERAKKAMDYFLSHSGRAEHRSVTFYGGEPLLQIDLIERCVDYAREQGKERPPRFQLTTNGTLLTPANAERMVAMDMNFLVSVDGPQDCHDRNRVFRKEHGTHEVIARNLRQLREQHPEYYDSHIGFACVLSPSSDPVAVKRFFDENPDLFGKGILVLNFVNDVGTDYWEKNPPTEEWQAGLDGLRGEYYRGLLDEEPDDRFLSALFQPELLKIYRRPIQKGLSPHISLNGCCLPGTRRLYVDVHGRFHMCERMNRSQPIGDIETGIDRQRVEEIWNGYKAAVEEDCTGCWVQRFCSRCFTADGAEGFDQKLHRRQCASRMHSFSASLVDYCELTEINPFAFAFMDAIVIR